MHKDPRYNILQKFNVTICYNLSSSISGRKKLIKFANAVNVNRASTNLHVSIFTSSTEILLEETKSSKSLVITCLTVSTVTSPISFIQRNIVRVIGLRSFNTRCYVGEITLTKDDTQRMM